MKTNNKHILIIFIIFSIIISFSHILIDTFFHGVSSKDIILKNGKEVTLKKETIFRDFLKKSQSIILSTKELRLSMHF